jgi:hypothetical protein
MLFTILFLPHDREYLCDKYRHYSYEYEEEDLPSCREEYR